MADVLGWIRDLITFGAFGPTGSVVVTVLLILYLISRNRGGSRAAETGTRPPAVTTGRVAPGVEKQWLAGKVVTIIDTAVCAGGEMAAMDYAEMPTQPPTIMRVIITPSEGWVWRCWFNGRTDNWYGSLAEAETRMVDLLTRSSTPG